MQRKATQQHIARMPQQQHGPVGLRVERMERRVRMMRLDDNPRLSIKARKILLGIMQIGNMPRNLPALRDRSRCVSRQKKSHPSASRARVRGEPADVAARRQGRVAHRTTLLAPSSPTRRASNSASDVNQAQSVAIERKNNDISSPGNARTDMCAPTSPSQTPRPPCAALRRSALSAAHSDCDAPGRRRASSQVDRRRADGHAHDSRRRVAV